MSEQAGPFRVATVSARKSGKTLAYRHGAEEAAFAGEHVHAHAPDGTWCVTWHPVGFLWARTGRRKP